MNVSRFTLTATLLTLLAACSKAPEAVDVPQPAVPAETSEDVSVDDNNQGGTPVTIHARIQYSADTTATERSDQIKVTAVNSRLHYIWKRMPFGTMKVAPSVTPWRMVVGSKAC